MSMFSGSGPDTPNTERTGVELSKVADEDLFLAVMDVVRELRKMNLYLSHMNDFIIEDTEVENA